MGVVRLDKDGNLPPGYASGDRPGDVAIRNFYRGERPEPSASSPKTVVTVTTDGSHVSLSAGAQEPVHFEGGRQVPSGAVKPQVKSREMHGGPYAESEVSGRRDIAKALPPEQMEYLKKMAREGHAIIIEQVDAHSAPAATPRGAGKSRER